MLVLMFLQSNFRTLEWPNGAGRSFPEDAGRIVESMAQPRTARMAFTNFAIEATNPGYVITAQALQNHRPAVDCIFRYIFESLNYTISGKAASRTRFPSQGQCPG